MIKTCYSTKDICQIFNIGRETLRHYERIGLLSPHINPGNGYREYSYWDICIITDILKYRSYGLSLADTKKTLFDQNLQNIIDSFEKQKEDYTRQLIRYELLLKKINKDLAYLHRTEEHLGVLVEGEMTDLAYIPFTTDPKDKYFSSMQTAFSNSIFFTTVLQIDFSDHSLDSDGLLTEKGYADFLGIKDAIWVPSTPIVCKILDLVGLTPIDETHIDSFRTEISQKYSREFNIINAALISRFYDDDKNYHQYFFVFAKLDK